MSCGRGGRRVSRCKIILQIDFSFKCFLCLIAWLVLLGFSSIDRTKFTSKTILFSEIEPW